ncbi:hypothetical protein [Lactobacillus amylovorus]|uniref:hypothetical protein n=1 Tax=Lactobacillus amylovorus TaxID=1604 RepID=UPI00232AB229|nr:hypothetical protein [Lactobacillus amylovorus]MDB6232762.1 hypothetical protein [Lactobacillus amylovorus]
MNYKYAYLSQIYLNKLLFHQSNTLNDGIALDKLIGMQLLPDNDSIVEPNDNYWDGFKHKNT